jgi:SAM-dependent methyltransferase
MLLSARIPGQSVVSPEPLLLLILLDATGAAFGSVFDERRYVCIPGVAGNQSLPRTGSCICSILLPYMYIDLLPYLRCPICGYAPLLLVAGEVAGDDIVEGGVRCERCEHVAAIAGGILDMLGDAPSPLTPAQLTNYAAPAAWGYERLWRWQALSLLSGRRFPLSEELRLVRGLIDPRRGGLLLDVACSNGLYARALASSAPPGTVVVGIDHARAMLREARRRARTEGLRISFVRATAQALPFRTGTAAGYTMGGSLNEIGDIGAALREARRVLGTAGRCVSMHLLAAGSRWGRLLQRLLAAGGIVFPDQAALRQQFAGARLQPLSSWRWGVVEITLWRPSD